MKKRLNEMTLEELWQLFPIVLIAHDPNYRIWYDEEREDLLALLSDDVYRINHIGSTAIDNLIAKPTIDILLEIVTCHDRSLLTERLENNGWQMMRDHGVDNSLVLSKGYTEDGFAERVFHLHVRFPGDWDELYFRDYLNACPDVAREYGRLKQVLKRQYEYDRDGYTAAKTSFVQKHTALARITFAGRYDPSS